jgi:hypothetical protein
MSYDVVVPCQRCYDVRSPACATGTGRLRDKLCSRLQQEKSHTLPFSVYRAVFDPDTLKTMGSALEEAWQELLASGNAATMDGNGEATRLMLANAILAAATDGERDQTKLRLAALSGLSLPR